MMINYKPIMHHEELKTPKVHYLFFFCNCVLFVVLQVIVFNVCSSME
jgi:hypothetical protein